MNLDEAIEQMKVIYDYMGGIEKLNGKDCHPPSILAAMMKAKARIASAEKAGFLAGLEAAAKVADEACEMRAGYIATKPYGQQIAAAIRSIAKEET